MGNRFPRCFLTDDKGEPVTNKNIYFYFDSNNDEQYLAGPNGEIRVAHKGNSTIEFLPTGTIHFFTEAVSWLHWRRCQR